MFSVLSADGNTQLVAVWLRTLSSEAVKIAELISYQSIKEGLHCLVLVLTLNIQPSLCRACIQASAGVLPGAHMVLSVKSTM